jgi:hypothetical protein
MKQKNTELQIKEYVLEQVEKLIYKEDEVKVVNVYPSLLEKIFDCDMDIIGGRDLDYEGKTNEYYFLGSAYYGNCIITKLNGKQKPKEEKKVEDVYTRTSFYNKGRLIENVPPVVECDETTLKELIENGTLKLYYIFFNRYSTEMIPFYAKGEWDVRLRALSIWGSYDDIKTEEQVLKIKKSNEEIFKRCYYFSEKKYVLSWE